MNQQAFWITFAVNSAVNLAESFVLTSNLTVEQKTALENLIAAGQAVEMVFTGGGSALLAKLVVK